MWPGLAGMVLLASSVAVIAQTHYLPVFGVQAARYLVAAATVVALAHLFRVRLVLPQARDIGWVIGGAMTGLVGFNLAAIVGTRHAEPALLGAAVACIPIVLAIAGPLAQGSRPSPRVVSGALVVSVGAVAVTGWGHGNAIGISMAVTMVACETAFTVFGARALPRMGAWSYSAATCVVATIVFAMLSILWERPTMLAFMDWEFLGAILYLGAIATAVAFVCWFTGVQRLGSGAVGLCAGIAAPSAALIGFALGAPFPAFGTWIGMAIIAAGLYVGFTPQGRLNRKPPTIR